MFNMSPMPKFDVEPAVRQLILRTYGSGDAEPRRASPKAKVDLEERSHFIRFVDVEVGTIAVYGDHWLDAVNREPVPLADILKVSRYVVLLRSRDGRRVVELAEPYLNGTLSLFSKKGRAAIGHPLARYVACLPLGESEPLVPIARHLTLVRS